MSYVSTAEPIKIGYLMDFRLPPDYPQTMRDDLIKPFELVFAEALQQKIIDRPIQIVYREAEGLPKGSVKAVIDAYGELVEEGCLLVYGPNITDNAVPTREAIEERFRVPAISVTGTEDWLGEWTFAFPMGSMTDEPIFWADLLAKRGYTEVGVLVEQSLVGESYLRNFRRACKHKDIRIVAEASIAQTAQDVGDAVRSLHEAKAAAIVHCGFGFGVVRASPVLARSAGTRRGSPGPRSRTPGSTPSCGTRSWAGPGSTSTTKRTSSASASWTSSRRRAADAPSTASRSSTATSRRRSSTPWPTPIRSSPRGVKEALERVKMLPAASGAPGTRISLGKWGRRAWVGAGYLVARRLDPDGIHSHRVARFGEE